MSRRSRIEQAMTVVDRALFVPDELKTRAYDDYPLPIGYGQTISQPTTVRMMLEWLDPQLGDRVLDIGSGSGWTTALLAYLVGPKGYVEATERVPELLTFGEQNCTRAGMKNVAFHSAGVSYGLLKAQPFDRVLVSASADTLPTELLLQLKINGKLILPVRHDILEITKVSSTRHNTTIHPGFVFVPLLHG